MLKNESYKMYEDEDFDHDSLEDEDFDRYDREYNNGYDDDDYQNSDFDYEEE